MNNDFNDIIKIIKTLEDSGVLIDGVTETVKHEKKGGFLVALLTPLATSLVQRLEEKKRSIFKSCESIYGWKILVPLHPLNNTEATNLNYESRFNGVFFKKQFT